MLGVKLLPEPNKFIVNRKICSETLNEIQTYSRKCNYMRRLQNGIHYMSTSMCWNTYILYTNMSTIMHKEMNKCTNGVIGGLFQLCMPTQVNDTTKWYITWIIMLVWCYFCSLLFHFVLIRMKSFRTMRYLTIRRLLDIETVPQVRDCVSSGPSYHIVYETGTVPNRVIVRSRRLKWTTYSSEDMSLIINQWLVNNEM